MDEQKRWTPITKIAETRAAASEMPPPILLPVIPQHIIPTGLVKGWSRGTFVTEKRFMHPA